MVESVSMTRRKYKPICASTLPQTAFPLMTGMPRSDTVVLSRRHAGSRAQVWKKCQDPVMFEEILRYLYLQAEPLAGTVVADALFPISETL